MTKRTSSQVQVAEMTFLCRGLGSAQKAQALRMSMHQVPLYLLQEYVALTKLLIYSLCQDKKTSCFLLVRQMKVTFDSQ